MSASHKGFPPPAWNEGDQIVLREVHRGRVWSARPATVVLDTPDLVVTYLAPGMRWKRPVHPGDGERLRMPALEWALEDATWWSRMLHLMVPGEAHAIHLWWLPPDWRFDGWYVNLQEPIRRTPLGFDHMDHMLDIVIAPDLTWRWKDEDELEAAVASGLVTRGWADEVRREGERVIRRLEARQPPFCDGWENWEPDAVWPIPEVPEGWDALSPMMPPQDAGFPPGSVVLITGIMGAGKSTVAQLLAERLPRAAHVRGDAFRRMIVSGRAEMVPSADAEALAQLRLRYDLAARVADGYAEARFTAVYQDIVLGDDLGRVGDRIRTRPLFVVVLTPSPEVVVRRADSRPKVSGYGEWTVAALDQLLRASPHIGLWLDTSVQTPEETVAEMWRRAAEARLD